MRHLPIPTPAERRNVSVVQRDAEPGVQTRSWSNSTTDDVNAYLKMIKRRKWMLILPLLVVLPLVALWLSLQAPTYEATAAVLIEPENLQVVKIDEVKTPDRSQEYYKSQYALLRSPALLGRVVDSLGVKLDERGEQEEAQGRLPQMVAELRVMADTLRTKVQDQLQGMMHEWFGSSQSVESDPIEVARRAQIEQMRETLRVEPAGMRLVNITLEGSDPEYVAQQVNTLASVYVEQNLESNVDAAEQASVWLSEKVQELKSELQQSELMLQEFIAARNMIPSGLSEKPLVSVEEFKNLSQSYAVLKAEQVDLEARLSELQQLQKQPAEQLSVATVKIDSSLILSLRERHADLELQRTELLENFRPQHPKVLAVRSKIRKVQQRLASEVAKYRDALEREYKTISKKLAIFEQRIDDKKGEIIKSNEELEQYAELKREIETKRQLYQNLLNRMNETEVTKSLQTNNVRVFQEAMVPVQPIASQAALKFLISAMVVFSLGIGAIFTAELLDSRFKTLDDVEEFLQIPFLGLIPAYRTSREHALLMLAEPRSAIADSYRILRTNLQMLLTRNQFSTLLVTSAVAGEGKTTTTSNIGVSFAQLGWRVLLLDSDLRRPALHRMFKLENNAGLSNVLTGDLDIHACMRDVNVENLRVVTSGTVPPNPAELLSEQSLQQVIDQVRDEFDLIIFDSAITLSIPDTMIMAPIVDGVCLVHNPDRSEKKSVETAKKMLERSNANILGIMFNNVKLRTSNYDDYHYYSSTYTVEDVKRIQ